MSRRSTLSRQQSEHENTLLLKMLEDPGKLSEICFIFIRDSISSMLGYEIGRYNFTPSSLGLHRVSELLAVKEDRHYGLPSTDEIYLFACRNFHAGIDGLQGVVNRCLGYYPKENELYVFVNHLHNQIKIYHLSEQDERIYQYKLKKGTYKLSPGFDKTSYEKINRTALVKLLDCPRKAYKK